MGLSADTNFFLEMTPKKKKSLDKKLKTQVTKYENDLEEYLDALDDARRCKYDEVKFVAIIFCNHPRFKFSSKWRSLASGSLNGWKMSQKHRCPLTLTTKGMVTLCTGILCFSLENDIKFTWVA